MKKILNIVVLLILKFLSLFIRKENMVIIGTYSRYRYGGNTKYLYEYLSMNTDLQVYWLTESMEIIDYLKSKGLKYLTNKKLFKKLIVTLKCKVIIDSGTGYYNPFNYETKRFFLKYIYSNPMYIYKLILKDLLTNRNRKLKNDRESKTSRAS